MTIRAAILFTGLLLSGCAAKTGVSEREAPVLGTFAPELRVRIIDKLGVDGVRLLETAPAFDVVLHQVDDDPGARGPVVAQRRIEDDDARAQVVQFFYDVAASEDPPCKCEPMLSYLVAATDGSAEARVIGHPVSVRVGPRRIEQVPPQRAGQTLSALLAAPPDRPDPT